MHAWEAQKRDKTLIFCHARSGVPLIAAPVHAASPDPNCCTLRIMESAAIQVRSKTEHLARNERYIRLRFLLVHEHTVRRGGGAGKGVDLGL